MKKSLFTILVALIAVLSLSAEVVLETGFEITSQPGGAGNPITVTPDLIHSSFEPTITLSQGSAFSEFVPFVNANVVGSPVTIGSNASIDSGMSNDVVSAFAQDHYIEFTLLSASAWNIESVTISMAGDGSIHDYHGYLFTDATGFSGADDALGSVDGIFDGTIYTNTIALGSYAVLDGRTSTVFRIYLAENHADNQANREFGLAHLSISASASRDPGAYSLTIEPVTGMVAVIADDLTDSAYYQFQAAEDLPTGNWTNIGFSFSGVAEADWMVPATNERAFFRMETSPPVTFYVDDYYEAADGSDDGPSVRRAVAAAQAHTESDPLHSARVLFTPNKVYQLEERTDVNPQIELYEAERISLEGNNALLVSYISNNHFSLWRCRDVTIRGFRLTCDPLPFTQGTLIDVDPATGRWDMQLDAGYDVPPLGTYLTGAGADNVTFHDPAGQHLHAWLNVVTGEQLSTNTFRFVAEPSDFGVLNDVAVGDRCAVKTITDYLVTNLVARRVITPDGEWVSVGAGNIELRKSDSILIQHVDSYASWSQTYHIFGCSNVTFDQAGYRPQPGTDNLLASNKGGLIMRSNPGPMVVTNCYLESAADDLINASDHPFDSVIVLATNVIEIADNMQPMDQSAGWNLLIMDPDTPALKGTCRIDSVVRLDGRNFELTLDQIEFEFGYSALSSNDWIYVERHGPVYVSNCTLVNNLKKGIISRGPTVVSDCLFSNLNYGIHHYYEGSNSNGEGPHAYGLEAVSNRFVDCTTGGVVLFSSGVSSFNVDQQNIVSGNVFDQSADGEGIKAVRMNGLTIENNTFTFDPSVPVDRQAIELVTCTNVTVSGNTGDRL